MNVGILFYSQTGNTLSVAKKLEAQLKAQGHGAVLEQVRLIGEIKPNVPCQFERIPDISGYDALIIGAPVHAFQLCAPMKELLPKLGSMQGKRVRCFITKGLFEKAFGGKRSIRELAKLCKDKGADVGESVIINWKNPERDTLIDQTAAQFAGAL